MIDVREMLDGIEERAVYHQAGVTAEDSRADVPRLVAALRTVLDLTDEILDQYPYTAERFYRAISEKLGGAA